MTGNQQNASGKGAASWILVTGLGQIAKLIISVSSTIVLARLLVPADFGLVATAAPIIGFVDLLRDAGFSQALVQRAEVTERQGHGLFWLTMAITVLLGVLVIAVSPVAATIFHEPRLTGVLIASAIIMQVSSFGAQPGAWLNRQLRFKALSAIDVAASILSLAVATSVAALIHNYWALLAASAAGALTSAGLSFWVSGWRPGRPTFDRDVLQMAQFGAGVSYSNVMNYLSRNADNSLIAWRYGPIPLGFYDRAYKLMLMPLTQITWPVSRVLTPVLSRLQNDPVAYAEIYVSTVTFIMVAAQPGLLTAALLGKPIVLVLLGAKWAPSIPIFQWLSAAAVHQVVTSSHGWLYLSQGRARHYAVVGTFGSITTVGAFLVGLHWGALGVAIAYTVSDYALRFPFSWLYVGRVGPVRTPMLLATLAPHIVASGGALATLCVFQRSTDPSGLTGLVIGTLTAYSSYVVVLLLFKGKRKLLIDGAQHVLARIRPMGFSLQLRMKHWP